MRFKEFARSGHAPTLLGAFLYFDISFMVWVMLGPLGTFIGDELKLSATQKGLMMASPALGGALLRPVLGALADRIGAKKTGLLGLALTMVPLLLGWLYASTFAHIVVIGLLLGIAGASFAVALPLASRWYRPEQQGLVLGIASAGNSGTVLAALCAPRLAQSLGWHAVFALALIPVGVVWLVFALIARNAPDAPRTLVIEPDGKLNVLMAGDAPSALQTTMLREFAAVLKERDTLWFCLMYAVTFGGFVSLATFLPIFFRDQYGLSQVAAGNVAALCVVAGSLVRPGGGYLADRFGGIQVLLVLYTMIGLLAGLVSLILPLTLETLLLFVIIALLGSGNGAVFQLVPLRYARRLGLGTGIIGAAGGLGGFVLPIVLGVLKDQTGTYGSGFRVFAIVAIACGMLMLVVRNGWQRTWARPEARSSGTIGQTRIWSIAEIEY
jgi:NNP family nitrate/nitrite transporter-like MFS transporter